jgi:hypothetical protein
MPRKKGALEWVLDGNGYSTTLSPTLARRLVNAHRSGDWPQMTAIKCGVHPNSLATYLKRGLEEYAVEPYESFAREFLQVEAEFSQRLLDVVVDAALGRRPRVVLDDEGNPLPRPSVTEAKWLLQTRFQVLWNGAGVSAIAMFAPDDDPARKAKALEILASMTDEQRATAKAAGFMVPKPQLATTGPVRSVTMARTGPPPRQS